MTDAEDTPNSDPDLTVLVRWIRERELVRERRECGEPPPWTADPVIATRRFCNVRREDDRVTRWIHHQIREPFADNPNLWLMLCICRAINLPETLTDLIADPKGDAWPYNEEFSPDAMAEVMRARQGRRQKLYTAAYVVPAPHTRGESKHGYVARTVIGDLWRRREEFGVAYWASATLEGTHGLLTRSRGWGDFLAYQAVVDMRFCPRLLVGAADVQTWAAAGPGTRRGLHRLRGRPIKRSLPRAQALEEIRDVRARLARDHGIDLDLSDVPNVLCEYDKYVRVQSGDGDTRQRFDAVAAYERDRRGEGPVEP